jgi:hypothetical protein
MVEIGKGPKGKTLRERSVFVYLPSEEMTKNWKELSDKAGCSISKFVIEHVENSLRQEDEKDDYIPRVELLDELRRIKEENQELQKQKKQLDIVIERHEKDLQTYQMKQWTDENYLGRSKYNIKLIREFQKRKEIRKEMLLGLMNVDPLKKDHVKALNAIIEDLEKLDFIKDMGGKWRWLL